MHILRLMLTAAVRFTKKERIIEMDSSGVPLIGAVIFMVLLLADFILSGFGIAVQTVTESSFEPYEKEEPEKIREILNWKDNPKALIHTCWLVHILTAAGGAYGLIWGFSQPDWLLLIISMVLIYVIGKGLPHVAGNKYAVSWCRRLLPAVKTIVTVCFPVTYVLTAAVYLLARLFGIDPHLLEDEVTEDEIISMVNEGHEQGVLDEHEAEMIQNIFELNDKEAQDVMTHRKNIVAINGCLNLSEAISFMVEESNSRFPVYEEDIDNIIGVLHFKDAMIFHNKNQYDNWLIKDIPELIRPVIFIPETRSLDRLFRSMQAQKLQVVIVVDEYGETAGLVTMEDILEEIVGNIQDEYDEDECFIIPSEDGSYRMDGMTPLEDVAETLGIHFEEEDYETLNGYLIYRMDRIPEEDEQSIIEEQGYSFQILEVENKTIKWVKVTKTPEPPAAEDGEQEDTAERE